MPVGADSPTGIGVSGGMRIRDAIAALGYEETLKELEKEVEELTTTYVVTGFDLARHILSVERSAAKDDTRPVLAGIQMEVESDAITFAAADGFRLSVSRLACPGQNFAPVKVIFPRDPLLAFVRRAKKSREVHIFCDGLVWMFINIETNESASFPAIDGTFPDWRQIMPTEDELSFVVNLNPKFVADVGAASASTHVVQILKNSDDQPNEPVLLLSREGRGDGEVLARHLIMPMVFGVN